MVVHAQPFLHVALSERSWREIRATSAARETLDGARREAKTHGLAHVAHSSTVRYDERLI